MLEIRQNKYFSGAKCLCVTACSSFFEIKLENSSIGWDQCDIEFTSKACALIQNSAPIFSEDRLFQETDGNEVQAVSPEVIFHKLNYLLTKDFQVTPTIGVTLRSSDSNSHLVFLPADDEAPAVAQQSSRLSCSMKSYLQMTLTRQPPRQTKKSMKNSFQAKTSCP